MSRFLKQPSVDFAGVRDGRRSTIQCIDIDLSVARSSANLTAMEINMAGNSFYADADPTGGNLLIQFQDTSFDNALLPLYVQAGAIFSLPFTKVLIENSAQAGKKLRIFYGVDVDFQAGGLANIAVTNAGGFSTNRPEAQTGSYVDSSAIVVNTPLTVFAPAANVNGAILLTADIASYDVTTQSTQVFISKSSAPATVSDGSHLLMSKIIALNAAVINNAHLEYPQYIAAGQGLYFIANAAVPVGLSNFRSARYKLL